LHLKGAANPVNDMKRILFPTDFSDSAHNALTFAGQYVKQNNGELVLYHAYGVLEPEYLENTIDKLDALARDVRSSYEISCRTIVEPTLGGVSKHINNVAERYDLVIMGTKGADSFLQMLQGSNAYNTILKADAPFLIIPLRFTGTVIADLVYAYDYAKEQRLPMQQLLPFLKALDNSKSLTILRVLENEIGSNLESVVETLSIPLQGVKGGLEIRFDSLPVSTLGIASTINHYMANRNATALCLCTQRRKFFEHLFHKSIIKEISSLADYPLFVFHN
jgi:nucleotide-binding universal stress UspA family protein